MARVFRRGELKEAIVMVLDALGEAHGYGIMAELEERVGGGWKPSPGAIYPALLALVETGHVTDSERDGSRVYSLTADGRKAAEEVAASSRWASLSKRAAASEQRLTLGSVLDRFAAGATHRRRHVRPEHRSAVDEILARAIRDIEATLNGEDDG